MRGRRWAVPQNLDDARANTLISEELIIRRVRADEWAALRDLRCRALTDAPQMFGTTLAEAKLRSEAWWQDAARRGESGDRRVTFVAAKGHQFVGMATGALEEEHVAELLQMWVEPRSRQRGIGAHLCRAVLVWAMSRQAAIVRLQVNEEGSGAVALYRSVGFRDTGRREPDLFHGREGVAMIMEASVDTFDSARGRWPMNS
jgi:ribosomal protein S18 acetylase RimI-like enzyme